MTRGPELGFDDDGRPVLITAAAPSYEEQHRERVRKYLTLMAFRVPALILAAIAYGQWHNGWISLLILAASIPLPWIAVLIANDRPPRRPDEPRRYDDRVRNSTRLEPPAHLQLERFKPVHDISARDTPVHDPGRIPPHPRFIEGAVTDQWADPSGP